MVLPEPIVAGQHEQALGLPQPALEPPHRVAVRVRLEVVLEARLVAERILGEPEVLEMLHGDSSDE